MVSFVISGTETLPGPASSPVTLATSRQLSWSSIPTGPIGTQSRKLYRTLANGSTYYYLATINDNSITTHNDNTPDSALTGQPRPQAGKWHKGLYAEQGYLGTQSTDSFIELRASATGAGLFVVKPDGKVGIGTLTPLAPFHCVGPFLVDGAGGQNTFRGLSSTTDTRVKIDSGAGGTATQSVLALSDQNTNKWDIVKAADNHFLIYDVASSADRFHIAPDGNVGIGGIPSYKLQVFGVNAAIVGGSTTSDTRFLLIVVVEQLLSNP